MLNVYCIPGMGVNEHLFQNLKLNNCKVIYIKWEVPFKNESLPDYAMRLAKQIDQPQPFILIGVSFGGMCCSEISRQLNPLKTILISSCKTSDELPLILKIGRVVPLYKIGNDALFIRIALLIKRKFGIVTEAYGKLFLEMLNTAPSNYFSRIANCIINWEQKKLPANVIHIHGTADEILPFKKIKDCNYRIKNGTHWMVMDRAEEISEIINGELNKIDC